MPVRPRVTVGVASYNCAGFLSEALNCILNQTLVDLEVIVVDDASTDNSVEVAQAVARRDRRVHVDVLPENGGPGAARNRILELARGDWYAVVDSDDLIHPRRLETLVAVAEQEKLDLVADNLLLFSSGAETFARPHFVGARARRPTDLTLQNYLAETLILVSPAHLGFIKPIVRLDALRATGLSYDAAMRIGEDDDLLVRLLAAGLKGRTFPQLTYFYRKHTASVSHNLSDGAMTRIVEQERRFRADLGEAPAATRRALDRRRRTNADADSFVKLIAALKARRLDTALALVLARPSSARLLHLPIAANYRRAIARAVSAIAPPLLIEPSSICIVSCRHSVTWLRRAFPELIDLANALKVNGFSPHILVAPALTALPAEKPAALNKAAIFLSRHAPPRARLAAVLDGFDALEAAAPYLLGAARLRLIALANDPGETGVETRLDLLRTSAVDAILAFDEASAAWASRHAPELACLRMVAGDDATALTTWLRRPPSGHSTVAQRP
jgi:succinoglycan biosynthesis protein ExoO